MAINPPVDATKTPEWAALQKHYDELQSEGISLKQWFADDAARVEKLSFDAGDLHFDLSKNLIKPETLQLFADLAKAVKLDERTKAMYTGVHINNTEDRAVLHTALRRPIEDEGKYIVDGQDTVKDVREVLDRIYAFAGADGEVHMVERQHMHGGGNGFRSARLSCVVHDQIGCPKYMMCCGFHGSYATETAPSRPSCGRMNLPIVLIRRD